MSKNIRIDFKALFEVKADSEEYLLSIVVVRSKAGQDTKETIKPFIDLLDNGGPLRMKFESTTYYVKLTSRIRMWTEFNEKTKFYDDKIADLDSAIQNKTGLFSTTFLYRVYDQNVQVLSPLLYCQQIQLNGSEFEEKNGRLVTLLPSRKITISYYRRMSLSMARICIKSYTHMENIGGQTVNDINVYLLYLYCIWICIF